MGGSYFFGGGGTGGHIYPAIAVAEKIIKLEPDAEIHFFCSNRDIDAQILSKAGLWPLHRTKRSTAIRQIVDKAVISEGIIDVFDAAGIKKLLNDEI